MAVGIILACFAWTDSIGLYAKVFNLLEVAISKCCDLNGFYLSFFFFLGAKGNGIYYELEISLEYLTPT